MSTSLPEQAAGIVSRAEDVSALVTTTERSSSRATRTRAAHAAIDQVDALVRELHQLRNALIDHAAGDAR